jgi:HlyD family secretion protein
MRRIPFFALLLAGCSKDMPAPAPAVPVAAKIEYVQPQKQSLKWTIEQPGTVHAFETTPVVAKLPGFVSKVHADIGDAVTGPEFDKNGQVAKPGQLLAEVFVPEQVLEAKQKAEMVKLAAAEVAQAKASLAVADQMVAADEAQVAVEKAGLLRAEADGVRWASELKRVEGLSVGMVVDTQTLDETKRQAAGAKATEAEASAKVLAAQAAVKAALARKQRAVADAEAADAKRKVAEAEAAKAEAVLEYTRIRAPYSGFVTARMVHTGHFLQPGAGGRAEAVFTVARLDTVRVFVDVPEASAVNAAVGTPVVLRFPALNYREVAGTVTRTSKVLSADSRTLRVEVDLPNADGSLTPGLYCTVGIQANTKEAWVLPAASILFADETAYAFMAKDGKLVKVRVQMGRNLGTAFEVLRYRPAATTSGDWQPFQGGEKTVAGNLGALADGQAVN